MPEHRLVHQVMRWPGYSPAAYVGARLRWQACIGAQRRLFGGTGQIGGTVKVLDAPAARTVRVYDRATGLLLAETRSAADGSYSVRGLARGRLVLALAIDDRPAQYNAAVADLLEPA